MMFLTPGISFTPRCTACATTFERTVTLAPGAPAALQRIDDLAPDRLELALARIAELDVDGDTSPPSTFTFFTERGGDEVLAGVRIDEFREDRLNVRFTERHARSVS